MRKGYVKSLREYKGPFEVDRDKLVASVKRLKKTAKLPTSVALEIGTIQSLKKLAERKGVPYQVLMRMFIIEGLRKTPRKG